jgi:hypothetical protein
MGGRLRGIPQPYPRRYNNPEGLVLPGFAYLTKRQNVVEWGPLREWI